MEERWRKPLNVLDIEHNPSEVIWTPDGRQQRQVKIIYDRESTERIRLGYACAKCMEVFEHPWPELCPLCGAPIRARQAEYFAREFEVIEAPSRPSWDEEQAGVRERAERSENGGPR